LPSFANPISKALIQPQAQIPGPPAKPPAASRVIWARTVGLIAVVTVIVLAIGEVLGHG
jgi:hypothetical protein